VYVSHFMSQQINDKPEQFNCHSLSRGQKFSHGKG
jgi:hypothetical protein